MKQPRRLWGCFCFISIYHLFLSTKIQMSTYREALFSISGKKIQTAFYTQLLVKVSTFGVQHNIRLGGKR